MKKYIKFLIFSLIAAVVLISCSKDEDTNGYKPDPTDIGGYATLTNKSITRFDRNSDLKIKFFTDEGVSVESVEILKGGQSVGTATVSGETATFNSSILGDFNFTDEDGANHETGDYPIRIRTTYSNGNVSEDPFTIKVGKAVKLGKDNSTETTLDSLSTRPLTYDISTLSANVDSANLQIKKGSGGTYTDSGVDVSTEGGSINLGDTNYESLNLKKGDTLFYQFTTKSGDLTDIATSSIVVMPKAFASNASVTLSSNAMGNQFNFGTGEVTAEEDAMGEIQFMDPNGFEGANGSNIKFVKIDDDDFYTTADVLDVKDAYAEGTKIKSVSDAQMGDVYVYKITRDGKDFYGVFKIGDVSVVNGNESNLDINYFEGR